MKEKKGQTTIFVILGIVIVAVALLLIFLRGQFFFGPVTREKLQDRFNSITDHVQGCIEKIAPDYIQRIGSQGGHLKTPDGTYRLMQDVSISYLCYNIPGKPICANRMLTLHDMEQELNDAIGQGLKTCLNLGKFKSGVDLKVGTMNVDTVIGDYDTLVRVNLPIVLSKGELSVQENSFSKSFNYPLGKLYNVAMDIVDVETQYGDFEQLTYMLAHQGQIIIDKKKPYPDKLYILNTKDSPYTFQFFIEGEPS